MKRRDRIWNCPYCNRRFRGKGALLQHLQTFVSVFEIDRAKEIAYKMFKKAKEALT